MKRIANVIWEVLVAVGQYRYEQTRRRGHGMY